MVYRADEYLVSRDVSCLTSFCFWMIFSGSASLLPPVVDDIPVDDIPVDEKTAIMHAFGSATVTTYPKSSMRGFTGCRYVRSST